MGEVIAQIEEPTGRWTHIKILTDNFRIISAYKHERGEFRFTIGRHAFFYNREMNVLIPDDMRIEELSKVQIYKIEDLKFIVNKCELKFKDIKFTKLTPPKLVKVKE